MTIALSDIDDFLTGEVQPGYTRPWIAVNDINHSWVLNGRHQRLFASWELMRRTSRQHVLARVPHSKLAPCKRILVKATSSISTRYVVGLRHCSCCEQEQSRDRSNTCLGQCAAAQSWIASALIICLTPYRFAKLMLHDPSMLCGSPRA